jgi:beta-glucosidase
MEAVSESVKGKIMATKYMNVSRPEPTGFELNNRALARTVAAEGMVLLENDGTLPLAPQPIALYGVGARHTVKGGSGSGIVNERYNVTIDEGLRKAGYTILTNGWLDRFDAYSLNEHDKYRAAMEAQTEKAESFMAALTKIPTFIPPADMPIMKDDIADCDTAFYVISRIAGEGHDRKDIPGDYELSEVEKKDLKLLSDSYKNLVVVLNVGGQVDLSFLDTIHVSAVIDAGLPGEEGGNAFADAVSGRDGFSGKLVSTWTQHYSDWPNASVYSEASDDPHQQDYVEGIYVGYRYFDTFHVKPRYAFGHGLTYTSFDLGAGAVTVSSDGKGTVSLPVTVRNVGKCPSREIVQLYATVPFGEDGAEYQRLVAFGKTAVVAAGGTEHMTLTFPLRRLARYDEKRSAFVLPAGDYVLRLGEASDETHPVAVLHLGSEIISEKCSPICADTRTGADRRDFTELKAPARRAEDLSDVPVTAVSSDVLTTLDHSDVDERAKSDPSVEDDIRDPFLKKLTDEQLVHLVVGGGVADQPISKDPMPFRSPGASGTTTQSLWKSHGIPNITMTDGPAGLKLTAELALAPNGMMTSSVTQKFLDQNERYLLAFKKDKRQKMIAMMPKPGQLPGRWQYCTDWPSTILQAQTWDTDLLRRVGDGVGTEMDAYGLTIWEAPGMDILRNPLAGRTFEYYSEDPLISGTMAGAATLGVQEHPGKAVDLKHFACNDCEFNRVSSSSNLSERALREIHLEDFRIAIEVGNPLTIMCSYNLVNGRYVCNSHDLLTTVLRGEWGWKGLVISDWDAMQCKQGKPLEPQTGDVQLGPAAGCDVIMAGRTDQHEALLDGLKSGVVKRSDLERAASRLLRLIRLNTVMPFPNAVSEAAPEVSE